MRSTGRGHVHAGKDQTAKHTHHTHVCISILVRTVIGINWVLTNTSVQEHTNTHTHANLSLTHTRTHPHSLTQPPPTHTHTYIYTHARTHTLSLSHAAPPPTHTQYVSLTRTHKGTRYLSRARRHTHVGSNVIARCIVGFQNGALLASVNRHVRCYVAVGWCL